MVSVATTQFQPGNEKAAKEWAWLFSNKTSFTINQAVGWSYREVHRLLAVYCFFNGSGNKELRAQKRNNGEFVILG